MIDTTPSSSLGVWNELDPNKKAEAGVLLWKVLENAREASKRALKAYYSTLILGAAQWFLVAGEIKQLNILSQSIETIDTVIWLLPFAMSITFYQGFGLYILARHCSTFVNTSVLRQFPVAWGYGVDQLVEPPSLIEFERLSHAYWQGGDTVSLVTRFVIVGWLILVPPVIIVMALWGAFARLPVGGMTYIQAALFIGTVLLLLRTGIAVVMFLREKPVDLHYQTLGKLNT